MTETGTVTLPWPEYLDRLGYQGEPEPSLQCLRELYTAHLRSVPYEMLEHFDDGTLPVLGHAEAFDKLVHRRRGGNCLEATPLFGRFLREVGFEVRLVSAQIWKISGDWWEAWDHLLLVVTIEGVEWLVDVGFVMLTFPEPLRADGSPQEQSGWRFRVATEDGFPTVSREEADGSWTPIYRYADKPLEVADYAWIVDFHASAEDSPLVGTVLCARNVPDGKLTLLGETLLHARSGRLEAEFISTTARAREVLADIFLGHEHLLDGVLHHWERARAERGAHRRLI